MLNSLFSVIITPFQLDDNDIDIDTDTNVNVMKFIARCRDSSTFHVYHVAQCRPVYVFCLKKSLSSKLKAKRYEKGSQLKKKLYIYQSTHVQYRFVCKKWIKFFFFINQFQTGKVIKQNHFSLTIFKKKNKKKGNRKRKKIVCCLRLFYFAFHFRVWVYFFFEKSFVWKTEKSAVILCIYLVIDKWIKRQNFIYFIVNLITLLYIKFAWKIWNRWKCLISGEIEEEQKSGEKVRKFLHRNQIHANLKRFASQSQLRERILRIIYCCSLVHFP